MKGRMRLLRILGIGLATLLVATPALSQGFKRDPRAMQVVADATSLIDETKHALVIGNADYDTVPLKNPKNDAKDIAKALEKLGFDVDLSTNVDQEKMEDAIRAFGKKLSVGGIGLFYYAGHGVQVDGENFMIPIGAKIVQKKDIRYKAVHLGQVLDEFAAAKNRLNILIMDACRDNPFRGFRGGTRGLAETKAPRGTMVAYATSPGSVAADGDGRNGVYTSHLLNSMQVPGLTIEQMFKQVRIGVVDQTEGAQTPWESSSLTGDFYFTAALAREEKVRVVEVEKLVEVEKVVEVEKLVEVERIVHVSMPPPGGIPGEATPGWEDLWNKRLASMKTEVAAARSYEGKQLPSMLKAEGWQMFLEAFSDDNPFSDEDEKMRTEATERVAHWRSMKDEALPERPAENKAEAARQALKRYKLAYEARDIDKLSGVWVMNPAQQDAMRQLFECANYVKLDVEERDIQVSSHTVSIDFEQEVDFDGPTCIAKAGGRAVKMTATMMPASDYRWMISSILPTRK